MVIIAFYYSEGCTNKAHWCTGVGYTGRGSDLAYGPQYQREYIYHGFWIVVSFILTPSSLILALLMCIWNCNGMILYVQENTTLLVLFRVFYFLCSFNHWEILFIWNYYFFSGTGGYIIIGYRLNSVRTPAMNLQDKKHKVANSLLED